MSAGKKQPDEVPDSEKVDADGQDLKQDASSETPQLTKAERELVDAQDKAEENWELYLRTAAELENVRKRSQRELENARRYGIDRFAQELLAVADSLENYAAMLRAAGQQDDAAVLEARAEAIRDSE